MFTSAIVKLTSLCNLNCSYCYMYNLGDKSYKTKPNYLEVGFMLKFLERIKEYLDFYNKKDFSIILHGGEPTLWSFQNFEILLKEVDLLNQKGYNIHLGIQTNLYKIDFRLFSLFRKFDLTVGVSLDGPSHINDKNRITHGNKGSYETVIRNVNLLKDNNYSSILGGFLSVVNLNILPKEYLNWVNSLPLKSIDVLWPQQFNYNNPPWTNENDYKVNPKYGKWFFDLFKEWIVLDNPDIYIRLFYYTISNLSGFKGHIDFLVNDSIRTFCLNTDGGYEYHDYFRAYDDGATQTSLNLLNNSIHDLENDTTFKYLLNLNKYLPDECKVCKHVNVCGGGFLPGRFNKGNKLPERKSILCYDEFYFFENIKSFLNNIKFSETYLQ